MTKKKFKSESYFMRDNRQILVMANNLNNMCAATALVYQSSHYAPSVKSMHTIHNGLFINSCGVTDIILN